MHIHHVKPIKAIGHVCTITKEHRMPIPSCPKLQLNLSSNSWKLQKSLLQEKLNLIDPVP